MQIPKQLICKLDLRLHIFKLMLQAEDFTKVFI